jgi:hypothetical protein
MKEERMGVRFWLALGLCGLAAAPARAEVTGGVMSVTQSEMS